MAERQRQINFGGQVNAGAAAAIGGSVSSGSGRGPASALLDGLIGSDKEQKAREKQRVKEQRAEIIARQKQALKAFTTSTQISVEDNISRIGNQSPNNPQAIKTKGEALISGMMDTLPQIARPVFQAKATKTLNQKIAVANNKAIEITRTKADLEAAELQGQLLGKLRDVSKNRFSQNDDLRIASEEELLSVQAEMLAPFMETAEDFEGNEFDLFTAKEIDNQVDNIDVISLESGIEGWFDSQDSMAVAFQTIVDGDFRVPGPGGIDDPRTGELGVIINPDGTRSTERSISVEIDDKIFVIPTLVKGQIDPKGVAEGKKELTDKQVDIAIDRFIKRGGLESQAGFKTEKEAKAASIARSEAGGSTEKFVATNALDMLPDNGRALLARLNTKMTARNRVDDEQDRLDDESRDKEQALNLFDAYETIENPNSEKVRITPGEIEEQVLAGELDPEKAIQLLKAATAPEVIKNDPLLFNLLTSMLLADQDIETFINNSDERLTKETLFSLRTKNKANQARLAGIVQSERESLIKQEERSMFRVIDTVGPFGIPDPNVNERIAEATTEYNRRVDADEDPVEVRRELVRRARVKALNNDEFTGPLIKPRFMPMTRNKITSDTLKQGAGRLVTNFKAGKMSRKEFTLQKKLFIQWTSQLDKRELAEEAAALEEARKKTNGK